MRTTDAGVLTEPNRGRARNRAGAWRSASLQRRQYAHVSVVIRRSRVRHTVGTSACDDGGDATVEPIRRSTALATQGAFVSNARPNPQLFNALLEQRRDRWSRERGRVTDQYRQITELRASDPAFAAGFRECQDGVLHRLNLAYEAFFRRVGAGEKPGPPRFKSAHRRNQLEFPHGGRVFVVHKNGRWCAVFECHREIAPLPSTLGTLIREKAS